MEMFCGKIIKVAESERKIRYMERYRSGHNEAVLKTVCPQGRVGSNPTLSVFISAIWRSTQAGRRGSPGKGVGR